MPAKYFLDANILIYTVGNITLKKQRGQFDHFPSHHFDANDDRINQCNAQKTWL